MSGGLPSSPFPAPPANGPPAPGALPPPQGPRQRLAVRREIHNLLASLSVTGSGSNAGKTWLCQRVLETLAARGFQTLALKVTRAHRHPGSEPEEAHATFSAESHGFEVITDRSRLDVPGKDTGRYYAAGATEVRWLRVQSGSVPEGLRAALATVPAGFMLVAEGNSFRDHVEPDLTLMMLSDRHQLKPSARSILDQVDVFVTRPAARKHFRRFLQASGLGQRPLLHPEEVASFVLQRLGQLACSSAPGYAQPAPIPDLFGRRQVP